MSEHKERAHSKFSASGSGRWLNCAASVSLEEASPPSKDSHWSLEGTFAHEVLEAKMSGRPAPSGPFSSMELNDHVNRTVSKIRAVHKVYGGTLLVEKKVFASFIHPEMFGTCDILIAGSDGTLHVMDFKYGAGHIVQAEENTQMIQYALSAAESYDWAFDRVKMWVLQPRAGNDWHKSWLIPMSELKGKWLPLWHKGVARVERGGNKPQPGSWCHWCRAKLTCPAKNETRSQNMTDLFNNNPIEGASSVVKKSEKPSAKQGEAKEVRRGPEKGRGQSSRQESKGRQSQKETESFF